MRKFFGLVIVIIIASVAVWLFGNKKPASEENLGNQENQESQESALASTSTISQLDDFYNIKAEYPQFTGADPAFNKKIADLITGKIDAFKKDVKENFSATPTEPFDFIADWKPTQLNDQYISFVMTMYYFTGGAHGINEVSAFNYDVVNKKEITISDFSNSSEENLQKLSDLAIQKAIFYLETNVGSVDGSMKKWVEEGAGPKWENFKDFNFKDGSMIVYFQQYQVAAGAVGPVTITLSKNILEQNYITSNYLK